MDQAPEQSGVINTMEQAMAELDRRAAARGETVEEATQESEEDTEPSADLSADESEGEEVATEDEAEQKEAETADPSLEEVEYEGKQYKLPPEIKGALLRQQDYTQKTQAVAEEKRTVDAARQQTEAAAQQLQQTQQALAFMAKNLIGQEPDLALAQTDPSTFLVLQSQHKQRVEQFNALLQQGQALTQQQQQQQQAARAEYQQREAQALFKAMPELTKPEKLAEFRTQAVDVGTKYGFTAEEIAGIADHRMVLALRDLAKFQRQAAQGGELKTKLANVAPKVAKPGAAATQAPAQARHADAMRQFKKAGGTDRALRELLSKIP